MNILLLLNEINSVGLNANMCNSDGDINLTEPDITDLVPLVLAAHGQPLSSDECLALQMALTEQQWLAYQDARKAPIRQQRAERYKNECDAMFLKCFEEATLVEDGDYYNCKVAKANFDGWKAAKEIVRSELPYPT